MNCGGAFPIVSVAGAETHSVEVPRVRASVDGLCLPKLIGQVFGVSPMRC